MRTLLVLVCAVACVLGYCAHEARRFERSYAAARSICPFFYSRQTLWGEIVGKLFSPDHSGYGEVTAIGYLETTDHEIYRRDVTPKNFLTECAAKLQLFPYLESVHLSDFDFSGSGIEALSKCRTITAIGFHRCNIDNESLRALSNMGKLTQLTFDDCNVSKEGVAALSRCSTLKSLALSDCDVDDGVFTIIARNTFTLSELDIIGKRISVPRKTQMRYIREIRETIKREKAPEKAAISGWGSK